MSGCLDRVDCRCDCDCLDAVKEWLSPKRNMIASIVAGCLVRSILRFLFVQMVVVYKSVV